MIQIDDQTYFYLFFIIPVVIVLFVAYQIWRKKTRRRFANPLLLRKLSPERSKYKSVLKLIFFLIGLSFLILGLTNPKIGTKLETVKREGVDIVFAVDVSKAP